MTWRNVRLQRFSSPVPIRSVSTRAAPQLPGAESELSLDEFWVYPNHSDIDL